MRRYIVLLGVLLLCALSFSQEVASLDQNVEVINSNEDSFIFYRPSNFFESPDYFLNRFDTEVISRGYYTEEETKLQYKLNTKEEAVYAFSEGDDRFFLREIDQEDITPYTWKWVHLQVEEIDGSYTNIHLRRPNWWFIENNVTKEGDATHISIPQIGLDKIVYVVKIYPNQLDTRFWNSKKEGNIIQRPITGKVEHYVNNVVDLYFEEGDKNPLEVTTNHLLWSNDRNEWIKVEDLKLGEKLTTRQGIVTIKERIAKEGWYVVYDLEVYRDHNFLVGSQNILAHNGCSDRKKKRLLRFLNANDAQRIDNGQGIVSKGKGGTILDQVQGKDTKFISLSEGVADPRFDGGHGLIEIVNPEKLKLVGRKDVLNGVKKDLKARRDVKRAKEVLAIDKIPIENIKVLKKGG